MPFDKGVAFCLMRKQTYESKLESLLQSAQFVKKDATTSEVILKIELSISVVLSKALYTGFLGVHLAGSNLIRLWKLIGRNG